ncbi:MAG: cytochrome c [Flavobacteriia bacterium]|nr:cytochrome c [Flavobacteriia bacterium]
MVLKKIQYSIFLVIFTSCSNSQPNEIKKEGNKPLTKSDIKHLFESNCSSCHGCDGTLGMSGAKDLSISKLKDDEIKSRIQNGLNGMPSFEGIIEEGQQLDSIISYVKTLRK